MTRKEFTEILNYLEKTLLEKSEEYNKKTKKLI